MYLTWKKKVKKKDIRERKNNKESKKNTRENNTRDAIRLALLLGDTDGSSLAACLRVS